MNFFIVLLGCAVFGLFFHRDPVLATAVFLGVITSLVIIGVINGSIWLVQRLKSRR